MPLLLDFTSTRGLPKSSGRPHRAHPFLRVRRGLAGSRNETVTRKSASETRVPLTASFGDFRPAAERATPAGSGQLPPWRLPTRTTHVRSRGSITQRPLPASTETNPSISNDSRTLLQTHPLLPAESPLPRRATNCSPQNPRFPGDQPIG